MKTNKNRITISIISLALIVTSGCSNNFISAVESGDIDTIKSLLAENPELLKQRDSANGDTPLHRAAVSHRRDSGGSIAGVKSAIVLIRNGADVNAKNYFGQTPLHKACTSQTIVGNWMIVLRLEIAKTLIEHGADINARDVYGSTPLHYAAVLPFDSFAELLINNGANVNARENKGRTPLWYADLIDNKMVADFLRKHGAVE